MASGNSDIAPGTDSNLARSIDDAAALSPIDGYFSALPPQPEDEFIPDPEQRNTPAAKEIEAREAQQQREHERAERRAGTLEITSRHRATSSAASSIVSASSGGSVDTMAARDGGRDRAPQPELPSYDDAIAERPYLLNQSRSAMSDDQRTYRTMVDADDLTSLMPTQLDHHPVDVETQPLLQTPSIAGDDRWPGRWKRKLKSWQKKHKHAHLARKLFMLLLFVCVVTLIVRLLRFVPANRESGQPPNNPGSQEPETPPNDPEDPRDLSRGRLKQAAISFCQITTAAESPSSLNWRFPDPGSLEFTQTSNAAFAFHSLLRWGSAFDFTDSEDAGDTSDDIDDHGHVDHNMSSFGVRHSIRHAGKIIVERSEGKGVSLQVGAYHSHQFLARQLGFAADGTSILLNVPRTILGEYDASDDLCIYSFAVIQVELGYNLSNLGIAAEVMSIDVKDTLDLGSGTQNVALGTYTGAIDFPVPDTNTSSIRSRNIRVETEAGQITGLYPLYDSLRLITKAGLIDAFVDPQEADPENVKPAELSIESTAGKITANTPSLDQSLQKIHQRPHWPPSREYRTTVRTMAGAIDVRLLHGNQTLIQSNVGAITAALIPCFDPQTSSNINVTATSGLIQLDIADSISSPKAVLTSLHTKVISTVGSQSVSLPSGWAGQLSGRNLGGTFRIPLSGFVTDRGGTDLSNPLLYSIEGHRGEGNSTLESSCISGTLEWRDSA